MAQDKTTEAGSSSFSLILDQDVLECPICCELLHIPIYQCNNGHIACSMCIEKIKKICPSCKLPIGYNRCRAMERVIEASTGPCPNAKSGCKENVSYRNRPSHEKQCVFSPCSCPVRSCNYTGSYKELKNHVSVKHEEDLIPFTWETPLVVNSILREKITILKEEKDGELIVVQGFNGSHGRFVNVSCIAPLAAEIGGFVCHLKLSTLPSVMKQTLVVKKVQKMSDEEPQDDFMLIPSYMLPGVLKTLKCNNGHIACSMCIEKIKKICPSCKLPIGYNRCRAMERVIEASGVSCPNAKYGCKENVSYRNRSSHEKQCVFAPCRCPVRDCNYTGSYKELKNHVSVKHEEDLVPFTWETPLVVNSILSEKITILREEKDGEVIVVQGFNGSHGRFVNVSCIAPLAAVTGRFVCSLKLSTLPSVMKQVQKMSDEEPQEDFMLIPSYMLRGVLNTLKICIARGNARVIHV